MAPKSPTADGMTVPGAWALIERPQHKPIRQLAGKRETA